MKKWGHIGFFLLFVAVFFRGWFNGLPLSAGDWGYVFVETLKNFPLLPFSWDTHFGGGLGGNDVFLLALNTYYYAISGLFFRLFHVDWIFLERIIWYVPVIIVPFVSFYLLYRTLFPVSPYTLIASMVFTANSYVLMLVGGGQVGVAMGYALGPLTVRSFIRMWDETRKTQRLYKAVLAGGVFSMQLLFDLRMSYISLFAVLVLFVVQFMADKRAMVAAVRIMVVPVVVTIALHAFWLVPFVMTGTNPLKELGDAFINPGMVKYLSFAPFEHTLSLLHPNWPENIFGKIRFLQPEFLLIPILAFSALLFVSRRQTRVVRYRVLGIACVGLLGAFLAKGTNPPFGNVYLWMFEHVPGFVMLRDSSKFYALTALSYAMLIPFALTEGVGVLERRWRSKHASSLVFVVGLVFILFWIMIHRESALGTLTGTFKPTAVPSSYVQLQKYLSSDTSFSRVLWIPAKSRYGYFSQTHPALTFPAFQQASSSAVARWFREQARNDTLARYAVSHVVVPSDPKGELFLSDRKYDGDIRLDLIAVLDRSESLIRSDSFGDIVVYKTKQNYSHVFFSGNERVGIPIKRIAPTQYRVTLASHSRSRELIFSESYDPHWRLTLEDGRTLRPSKTADNLQAYVIPSLSRASDATFSYGLQRVVEVSSAYSLTALLLVLGYIAGIRFLSWKGQRKAALGK